MTALGAAAGLVRDHPDDDVIVTTSEHMAAWCRLFTGFGRLVVGPAPADYAYVPISTWVVEYAHQGDIPRWEYYAGACQTTWRLPDVAPVGEEEAAWASRWCDAVLLCPWAGDNLRTWLAPHWRQLETILAAKGVRTIVCDHRSERENWLRSEWIYETSAARVGALMHACAVVVGNDSGMAHVAGLLRRPTLALCGALGGRQTFGCYPNARWIQGPLPCSGCYMRGEDYGPACGIACASLQAIRAPEVAEVVMEMMR